MTLDELDEATSLSWRDLDIGDFAKPLEERSQFVLCNVTRQTSNENGGVVGIGELVHWLRGAIVAHWRWCVHGIHAWCHTATHAAWTLHATHSTLWTTTGLVLWGSSADTHWSVAAVHTLHFGQGALLITFLREAYKSIATRHSRDRIGHYLGRLARRESALEQRNQDIFINLWPKITNKDRKLWSTIITSVGKTATRCPIELEGTIGIWDHRPVQGESLRGSLGRSKIDKAITSITILRLEMSSASILDLRTRRTYL